MLITLVLITLIALLIGFAVVQYLSNKRLKQELAAVASDLDTSNEALRAVQLAMHQLSQSHRALLEQTRELQLEQAKLQEVGQLQQAVSEQLQNKLQLLESQFSENKLYVRAKKMLALGADIDELVAECGISRTEAELMLALNSNSN